MSGIIKRHVKGYASVILVFAYIVSVFMVSFISQSQRVSADGECSQAGFFPTDTNIISNGDFAEAPIQISPNPTPGSGLGYDQTTPGFAYTTPSGFTFRSQVALFPRAEERNQDR